MKSFYHVIEEMDQKIAIFVTTLPEVLPEDIGLDRRAGYRLYVAEDGILVTKRDDRALQYYGGFEYVDAEHRHAVGDWVFYSSEDERVQSCLDSFEEEVFDEDSK